MTDYKIYEVFFFDLGYDEDYAKCKLVTTNLQKAYELYRELKCLYYRHDDWAAYDRLLVLYGVYFDREGIAHGDILSPLMLPDHGDYSVFKEIPSYDSVHCCTAWELERLDKHRKEAT